MPDITSRYRLDLDTVSLMGQLAAVEAQAGGQIQQMVQPIQSSILQTFQAGVAGLTSAQGAVTRAAASTFTPGGLAGMGAGLAGGGFLGAAMQALSDAQPQAPSRGFFAGDLPAAGVRQGLLSTGLRASGILPQRDYRYTPEENRYLYAQQFTRQIENAVLGTARTGLEVAGGVGGFSAGQRLGTAVGRGLFGEVGGQVLGGMGAVAGARLGVENYGLAGGATLGAGLGGLLGGLPGAMAGVPLVGGLLGRAGAVTSALGTAAGGVLGAAGGGLGSFFLNEIGARNAIRPIIEDIGMTSVLSPESRSPLGTGFTMAQAQEIGSGIENMRVRDFRYGTEDIASILQTGGEAGAFEGGRGSSVDRFLQTTRTLINDVKTYETGLRKTREEAESFMKEIITSHGTGAIGQAGQIVGQLRGLSQRTGLGPDQLLQYGVTGPGLGQGAVELLGGIPEVAREAGLTRAQMTQAALEGVAMSKGYLLDEAGFSTRAATTTGAWRLAEGSRLQRELTAAAGGPDRLAQGTQGAMQSWLFSGTARMMALAGGPRRSWAETAEAAMGRIQNFEDLAEFELDYALEASRMSPQETARRMRAGAGLISQELPFGSRGQEYVLFKQLQDQGYGPITARAIMENLGQVERGAGRMARGPIPTARIESPEAMDRRRETGPGGMLRQLYKQAQVGVHEVMEDFYEGEYGPGLQQMASYFQGQGDMYDPREPLLPQVGRSLASTARGAAGLAASVGGRMASGVARIAGDLLGVGGRTAGSLGLTDTATAAATTAANVASGTTSRVEPIVDRIKTLTTDSVEVLKETMSQARDRFKTVTSKFGMAMPALGAGMLAMPLGAAPVDSYSASRTPGFAQSVVKDIPAPQRPSLEAAATAPTTVAPSMAEGGGIYVDPEEGRTFGHLIEGARQRVGDPLDLTGPAGSWYSDDFNLSSLWNPEQSLDTIYQSLLDKGFPPGMARKWYDSKKRALSRSSRSARPRAASTPAVPTSDGEGMSLGQLLGGVVTGVAGGIAAGAETLFGALEAAFTPEAEKPKALTPAEQYRQRHGEGTKAARLVLEHAGLGMEEEALSLLKAAGAGGTFKSAEEFEEYLIESAGMGEGTTPEVMQGVKKAAHELARDAYNPKTGTVSAALGNQLKAGATQLEKYKKKFGLSWMEKTQGPSRAMVEAFVQSAGSLTGDAKDIYERFRREEGGVSGLADQIQEIADDPRALEDLEGTAAGKLGHLTNMLEDPGRMKAGGVALDKVLTGTGLFTQAQAAELASSGVEGEALSQQALETAIENQAGSHQSSDESTDAVNLLNNVLREILNLLQAQK